MKIERVTVVGAGTMGHGIAQVAAQAGYRTVLYDVEPHIVAAGIDRIGGNLDRGIERGKLDAETKVATLRRLSGSADLDNAVGVADLVIEAAPERLELKTRIFRQIDAAAPEDCLLASNTSSLSIGALAAATTRPAHFLGMHFFNPVHIMALLEIVVHPGTSDATLEMARGVAETLGKTAIVVRDVPGFATSRLGVVLGLEAMRMLEQGVASAHDIDTAMELGYRHPMGPLKLTDLVGLDVRLGIAEYLRAELGSAAFEAPQILRDMVAAGRLGKKSGAGFYDWPDPE